MLETLFIYYLYLKTHVKTNLKYLGQTTQNPFVYKGSGVYWTAHLKIHGNYIKTEILYKSDLLSDIKNLGEFYSEIWDIVRSNEFANLINESASGGSQKGRRVSPSTKEKLKMANVGRKMPKQIIDKVIETKRKKGIDIAGHLNTPEIREKQIKRNNELMTRPIVNELRKLSKTQRIKLGSGWTRKSDKWILDKIKDIKDRIEESSLSSKAFREE